VTGLLRDIRYALRALVRAPAFTAGVVVTLALGIGVNAAMFGVVDLLFLRPPAGVRDAARIRRVYTRRTIGAMGTYTGSSVGYPTYLDLRGGPTGFEALAAVTDREMSLGRGGEAQKVQAGLVSYTYFPLLGVQPALGRVFGEADDTPGVEHTAVLSYGYWKRRFAGDSSVIGRALPMGRGSYTVIGVAPEGFAGINLQPVDLWVPIRAAADEVVGPDGLTSRGWIWMSIIGKLKPGVSPEAVAAQATVLYRRGAMEHQKSDSLSTVVLGPIQSARGPEAGSDTKVSAWVAGVALVVLLIACANVANLLLARGVARRRELAVRAGLGAGRGGLVRLLLSESLVLAALGGAAGLLLAVWGGGAARSLLIPNLPADVPLLDPRILGFTAVAVVLTAVLTGSVPALLSSRTDLAEALKSGARGATAHGGRTRGALLVLQVALTLVLLVGAGLFVRSLRNVQHLDLGFDTRRVYEVQMDLDAAGLSKTDVEATWRRALERVQRLPMVEHAAATAMMYGWGWGTDLRVEGFDSIPQLRGGGPYVNTVTGDFFATMGTRLLEGRALNDLDRAGGEPVAVVNETFARTLWQRRSPLGKCLYVGDSTMNSCRRIVGVVATAHRGGVLEPATMQYFLPADQYPGGGGFHGLVVRARGDGAGLVQAVQREMHGMGALPFADVRSLADRIAPEYRSWELGASAFTAFGVLALVIASMGIFAIISYTVSQRTQEIGIRMALGAEASQVARMVLGQGLRAALAGIVVGGAGAWALGRGVASLLFEVKPSDPSVFGAMAVALVGVATLAAWLPARRAARVDPMVALRSE
jgi:putative ABC transport system permease protein